MVGNPKSYTPILTGLADSPEIRQSSGACPATLTDLDIGRPGGDTDLSEPASVGGVTNTWGVSAWSPLDINVSANPGQYVVTAIFKDHSRNVVLRRGWDWV